MGTREQRFDVRFRCEIPVELVWNRQRAWLTTVDVGYRGMFLRTDTPPTLRQLLRIEVPLPDGETLALHGMAVHVVQPGTGRAPGVGVQFYAVDQALNARWSRFIDGLKRETRSLPEVTAPVYERPAAIPPLPPTRTVTAPRPRVGGTDEARRRHPRYDAELELEVHSVDELHRLASRDVSAGGMLIATDAPLDAGARLRILVKHPSRADAFALDAVVRRRAERPPGLGVEFVDLDDARREAFMAFIRQCLPTEEVITLCESDLRAVTRSMRPERSQFAQPGGS